MAKENKRKKEPDYLCDVLDAVELMDRKRLSEEPFKKAKEDAIKLIRVANSFYYPGFMSIRKARSLGQSRFVEAKERAKVEQAKLKNAMKRGMVTKKEDGSSRKNL